MNRIGIIEIGANSVTLMLNEIENNGYFRVIDELNTFIRLQADLTCDNKLSEEKLNTALSTIRSFKSMCEVSGVKTIIAVATESFKTIANCDMLVKLIKDELNIEITVLSSKEEIYYNYLGVINSIYFDNSLLVDIEGNSTHIAWIKDKKIKEQATLPIGTLNLAHDYSLQDRITKEDLYATKEHIDNILNDCHWLKNSSFDSIIGVGGTIKCASKLDRLKKHYPLNIAHNYRFYDIDVQEMYNLLKIKDLRQRKAINGLPAERADIIVSGLSIFNRIINHTNVHTIISSLHSLKEGIMHEYINNNYKPETDMLDYYIDGIMNKLNINKCHANNVYSLTKKLFKELKPLHKLGDSYDRIIKVASLLHDCGISINYDNHHKHSFYIILHSFLGGLTHKELLMSAAIAASHRNNDYNLPLPPFSSVINKIDLISIEYIGAILKIAEGLDRSLEGAVKDIIVSIDNETVKIQAISNIDLELEIRQALRSADSFKRIYNRNLIIEKIE